jgi:hypothetical protein
MNYLAHGDSACVNGCWYETHEVKTEGSRCKMMPELGMPDTEGPEQPVCSPGVMIPKVLAQRFHAQRCNLTGN